MTASGYQMKSDSASSSAEGKRKVLFLCTHNSARSQMAEGLLRATYGDRYEAYSAGVEATAVDSRAVLAMSEIGIDISGHTSKPMGDFLQRDVDTVITVCGHADQACPMFPGQANRHHWGFEDPAHAEGSDADVLAVFRRVRDEIRLVFEAYAAGLRAGKALGA